MQPSKEISAVILAGGRGRRMDGLDKGLVELHGRTLIEHVIRALEPQAERILINANRNLDTYAGFGYPVISDSMEGFQGPLAGFLSAMQAAESQRIVTVPCDTPQLPNDLVERLLAARQKEQAEIAVAYDGDRMQLAHSLIPVSLEPGLKRFLAAGNRKVELWFKQHRLALADFSDLPEAFVNINTPEEYARLQAKSPA